MAPVPKRRKVAVKNERVAELTFDSTARQEYLTGFHKRKQARIQSAREAAIKRDKEDKVKERKQLREQRKEDLENHVAAVNDELRKQNVILNGGLVDAEDLDDKDAWNGGDTGDTELPQPEQLPHDEEYVDEDKYTTVTVEPMGDADEGNGSDEKDEAAEARGNVVAAEASDNMTKKSNNKRPWRKDGEARGKVKKKKFRYESKSERAVSRQKQKSKNRDAKARRKGA